MRRALHVIKLGSSTALDHQCIFSELAELCSRRSRVLLVVGGALGIARHYASVGRAMPTLEMGGGDAVRYCPPEEIAHIVAAYETLTLPWVGQQLSAQGLSVFSSVAARNRMVSGKRNRPIVALENGRRRIVRDHCAGSVEEINCDALVALLDVYDVVCFSPPVADVESGPALNVDADMLAATLSRALEADHLRLVTSTPGVLGDVGREESTIQDVYADEELSCIRGRMKQKARAARIALRGVADVTVSGPHTMRLPDSTTRFWRAREPSSDLSLLSAAVQIPSVSGDEGDLADYLAWWCKRRGIVAGVDAARNLVASKGTGKHRLLLLGHLDTVPFLWPARWGGDALSGRGAVDAKASLVNFLETLDEIHVPSGFQVLVVGATEEEVSSSKGAFFVRDNYSADAVIVGEPSGAHALTLGYFGLFKLRLQVTVAHQHSAAESALSAPDFLMGVVSEIREDVSRISPASFSAMLEVATREGPHGTVSEAVLNFRLPPGVDTGLVVDIALRHRSESIAVEVLRLTPGVKSTRSSMLVRAFTHAFSESGLRPRFLVKRGTSDMNTLATTWREVPMVAYGPGDAALDHTDRETVSAAEYRQARLLLYRALRFWISLHPSDG
jgi:LysW-gamma-L-lysine carboxypeptidase